MELVNRLVGRGYDFAFTSGITERDDARKHVEFAYIYNVSARGAGETYRAKLNIFSIYVTLVLNFRMFVC